jgi:pSer/pThr/pTyr-binding forkhead associated (FHA) protein
MQAEGGGTGGSAWVDGEMMLRVRGTGREHDRIVHVRRPFALFGQAADSDVRISDPEISARHAYLHLDARGVYVVDLVTRCGTTIDGSEQMVGWISPGQGFEVAGRRIELLRMLVNGVLVDPPGCDDDLLLDDAATRPLVGVTLTPKRSSDGPWTLGSELIFLGWSSCCGIQIRDPSVAKVHCAILRTQTAAYVVDLGGHGTRVGGHPVKSSSMLRDGDSLTVGSTSFSVRIDPASSASAPRTLDDDHHALAPIVAQVLDPELETGDDDTGRALSESQTAIFSWMMQVVQENHSVILRQQGNLQSSLMQSLHELQKNNAALLEAHLARVEKIDSELAALRGELARRSGDDPPMSSLPPPPNAIPLQIERPTADAGGSQSSTAWLLDRVTQLEDESQSAWKDLFRRLSSSPRGAS